MDRNKLKEIGGLLKVRSRDKYCEAAENVMKSLNLTVIKMKQREIVFIPWKTQTGYEEILKQGRITWNPITDEIKAEYEISTNDEWKMRKPEQKYSGVLKWYLKNVNDNQGTKKGQKVCFQYPCSGNAEIRINIISRAGTFSERRIQDMILTLQDLFEEHQNNIICILDGNVPEKIRTRIESEIAVITGELQ